MFVRVPYVAFCVLSLFSGVLSLGRPSLSVLFGLGEYGLPMGVLSLGPYWFLSGVLGLVPYWFLSGVLALVSYCLLYTSPSPRD